MSIADELRKYASDATTRKDYMAGLTFDLNRIADRIDAEHEAMLVDARKTVYQGYIELPKDADGEHIHVGDEIRDGWHEQNQGEVQRLMLDRDGWWLMLKNNSERFYVHDFHEWHHHHKPPTVDDVLRELLDAWDGRGDTGGIDLSEFAAKLRLAGDAE